MKLRSNILKLALFATGLSGIVAEYILSTLATYFLGNSVFQWTMIVSIMLFSMGLGSGISRYIKTNLIQKFIYIEFALSVLVSYSSLIVYSVVAFSVYHGLIIYSLSIIIGILIGMEIPLAVRLNDEFESLRVNIASIIEKDYYGSLAGGLFFAFVGLPFLGLTYTPFVLGAVNFMVATALFIILWKYLNKTTRIKVKILSTLVAVFIVLGFFMAKPIILFGEQKKYKDKIVYTKQSKYQRIVITQWKDHYWLFINGNQQLSTLDEVVYHEPLVHPVMQLSKTHYDILVLGGGDGCAVREILKYPNVNSITLVDLDPAMTELGMSNKIIKKLNKGALNNDKVTIINQDGYNFLEKTNKYFDLIIIDLPDPRTVELGRLYSYEFYKLCYKNLKTHGFIITQAGSPYYATKAFLCINNTMKLAGFTTKPIHNQIITLGEWGWIIGSKHLNQKQLNKALLSIDFDNIETEWINKESMKMMTSFGKNIYPSLPKNDSIEINKVHNPVLYRYYLKGNWDIY